MQQSYRSPRQPVRTRSKPYTRRQPPPRSGSIMATIRNIVTAPLSWFSTTNEFEDTPGKRRRAPGSQANADASDKHRSIKRQRVASPPQQPQGYLDPPLAMFQPRLKRDGASQGPISTAFPSTLVNVNTQEHQPDKFGRHCLSATVWSRRDQSLEVSMDNPPSRLITRDATMIPLPVSREASLSSVPRDSSVGPVRTPFRMRTTLSPIPVGSDYGPSPRRRERDPSEPPPLTALMSNPIFVKPPPNQHPTHRSQSAQPTTTLGALAQTSRAVGSPFSLILRQSNLHLNHPPSYDPPLRPINASEIALSELAIYRTPLLPTRLRSSETIPEMFKPKKVHAVVPMKSGKRDLPRLGTGRTKKKGKKQEDARKPYSAHGSMKRLLQRRKMEEVEKNQISYMDISDANAGDGPTSSTTESVTTPLPELDAPQHRVYARETSSLRVGRSRMNRPDRHTSVRPSRTKFSAAFEDDDLMDQKDQDVPRFETKPIFEPPKDFTFARDTASVVDAVPPEPPTKEPPIAALPFSLTPESPKPSFPSAPVLPTPQPPVPVISLSPPTPKKNDSTVGIPNFFANSSLLTRTSFPPTLPLPSGNLFGAPPVKGTPQPTPPATSDQTPLSTGTKGFTVTLGPSETIRPIFPPPGTPATAAPTITSPATLIFLTPSMKIEPTPEPAPTPFGGDQIKTSFPVPGPSSAQSPPSLFGGLPSSTIASPTSVPPTTPTIESNSAAISSEQKGSTPSMFSFGSSSGTPFVGFGTTGSTESPKPFSPEQSTISPSPGESAKPAVVAQSEAPKEAKPAFSFAFKFGAPSPEKPATPQFGESAQDTSNSGIFAFGTSSNAANTQKPLFGGFPRPVTPPREEEEVRMEESPTRVVEVTSLRQNEDSFFAGRAVNFGQSNGSTGSPFNFGTTSGDSTTFGGKLEEKLKPSTGFTFSSPGSGFGQPSPVFTFGKADNASQPATPSSSSPFTFGTSKLPEISTFGPSQATNPSLFNFGQRPGSNQGPPGFTFGQQQPPATTSNPFNFGQGQTLGPPSFGQQNGSVPNSPSTFNQPLSFGFGPATPTSTSNPFNFQNPSPITTTPSSAPGFTFGQQPPTQAQPSTPVSPFPVPGSPQPAGGSLFNIGASPTTQSPGTRAIKKLPTRRAGARR
ncbi:hypothetical protein BDM02DRAFT_3130135 [Thelephora ganbajun]|uniref:Uncharacterized protein n=1 Tax=Thelephora ganbajun TaxID=370292 RepID=A0ACB6ZC22_THEGA|nr:hypothetical protein BDM02DRAFT_3130135 [Thelephora ganbajun]